MKKNCCCLLLIVFLLTGWTLACADPDLTLQDKSLRSGAWAEEYTQILTERSAGIRGYEAYVAEVTSVPACRPVGLADLTRDGIPELLFLELLPENEYGFRVGRFWIYTADWKGVHCVLTIQPEIDDMLYSSYYLDGKSLLTVHFSDMEQGWTIQFSPDRGQYTAETTLTSQEDFSGEGPDTYYQNGKKITKKKYESLTGKIRAGQGTMIGSLLVDDGGTGFTHTLDEALALLGSGEALNAQWPEAGKDSRHPGSVTGGLLPELSFFRGSFTAGQKYAVYSAPSDRSWRGASGKAAITSGSEIFVAGKDGNWVLILYELGNGLIRVGYVDSAKISGQYTSGDALSFARTEMTLTETTVMTDDPIRQAGTIGKLKKGTKVTCLAEYQGWIYVEAKVSGKTARGFIAPSSLGLGK